MDFKVLNDGYLKDGKITIDTSISNFEIVAGVTQDSEIKEVINLAGNRTQTIKNEYGINENVPINIEIALNDIQNGRARNI